MAPYMKRNYAELGMTMGGGIIVAGMITAAVNPLVGAIIIAGGLVLFSSSAVTRAFLDNPSPGAPPSRSSTHLTTSTLSTESLKPTVVPTEQQTVTSTLSTAPASKPNNRSCLSNFFSFILKPNNSTDMNQNKDIINSRYQR